MLRIPKIINVICSSSNLRTLRHGNKISQCVQSNSLRCKLSFDVNYSTNLDADNEEKPRRKTMRIPKITLVHPDNSITVTLLEEAEKLAKRRKLELVQVFNNCSKNERDVYKLKTHIGETQSQEDVATKEHDSVKRRKKSTKLFILKHKIDENDLVIKMNNINKSLKKGYKVKILHTNPNEGNVRKILKINNYCL